MARESEHGTGSPIWGGFQQVKFGPGVIGRSAPVCLAAIIALAVAMYFVGSFPWLVFTLALVTVALAASFLVAAFWYGHKHPDFSVLEGGELVKYREIELAAKDPKIIDVTPEGRVNTTPPVAIERAGGADG